MDRHPVIKQTNRYTITLHKVIDGYKEAEDEFNRNPGRIGKAYQDIKKLLVLKGVDEKDITTHPGWEEMEEIPVAIMTPDEILDIGELNKETGKFRIHPDHEAIINTYQVIIRSLI